MKNKYIFDLDGTLLDSDFSIEKEYFSEVLTTSESEYFIPKIVSLLEKYEDTFYKYDINLLSKFMSKETSINITPGIIKGWIDVNKSSEDVVVDGAIETLDFLKQSNKDIVLLTNWFSDIQRERLIQSDLIKYFDEIYGGEIALKPSLDAYMYACGKTPMESCVMIGNDYNKDVLGAEIIGLDSIFFDRKDENLPAKNAVKSLKKIKDIY